MTMRPLLVWIALALGAWSATAAAQTSDPAKWIRSIYQLYQDATNGPDLPPRLYSRRLQRLIDADARTTPKGEVGRLDFDVFVNGNNWELSDIRVATVSRSAQRAQVRANFISMKKPHEVVFDVVREEKSWRIDEVRSMRKPRWTMSKILVGAKDAFPDEGP